MKKFIRNFIIVLSIFALIITGAPFSTATVSAAEVTEAVCDEEFYSSNDILFYNPCAVSSCGDTSSGAAGDITALRGKNNGEKIFNYWVDAGLTSQQAAGITGSMYHEGGFSPFRQQIGKAWGNGGWGIAQFDASGQRGLVINYIEKEIGKELFDKYYKEEYGDLAVEEDGFIPKGVPVDVNNKFLLAELNYLYQHVKDLVPNSERTSFLKTDYGQNIASGETLYVYLKTLVQAKDAAIAWTYLYEYPGDIKKTANDRGITAKKYLKLYGKGIKTTCGGNLSAGGMTLEEAKDFMKTYRTGDKDSIKYIGGAGRDCPGGPLANCVSFSVYFINKYTTIKGMGSGTTPGNGNGVVGNIIARNKGIDNGHSPKPYAIFSTGLGTRYGHTGVILGVDTEKKEVIVGEARCSTANSSDGEVIVRKLSDFDNDNYIYAYSDGLLKGGLE